MIVFYVESSMGKSNEPDRLVDSIILFQLVSSPSCDTAEKFKTFFNAVPPMTA